MLINYLKKVLLFTGYLGFTFHFQILAFNERKQNIIFLLMFNGIYKVLIKSI